MKCGYIYGFGIFVEALAVRLVEIVSIIAAVCFTSFAGEMDYNDLSAYYGFGEMEMVKLNWGIGGLRIADINGDGRNDILIVNNRKARVEILIQKDAIGPGEPEVSVDPTDFEINAFNPDTRFDDQALSLSQKVYSMTTGDLNLDGMVDVVFYGEPRGLYIYLQKDNDDDRDNKALSWRTRKKIEIDDGLVTPYGLDCGDLTNDGLDDLVLACKDSVYIITQKEDGTLAEAVKYPSTNQIKAVEVVDVDGDGVNDLFMLTDASEKPVSVRFCSATGKLGPQVQFMAEKPWAVKLFNIDDSSGAEMLSINSMSGRLMCYKLVTETDFDNDWPILYYPLSSGQGDSKRDLVTGDFDGDGLVDIVISEPAAAEVIFYKQLPRQGLAEPKRFPALSDISEIRAADIDGDGKSELAVISVKEKIIAISEFEDERLSFPKPISIIDEPVAMTLADVDNDSKTDCVYIAKDANDTRWLRILLDVNKNGNLPQPSAEVLAILDENPYYADLKLEKLFSNPDGIAVLDADHDGLMDVLVFDKYNPPPLFARQVEKGKFEIIDSPQAQSSLIKEASGTSIAIADIDYSGGKELLVAQNNFARSLVFADSAVWQIVDQYNAKSKENKITAVDAFYLDGMNLTTQPAIVLLDGGKGQLQILLPGEDKTYRFEKQIDAGKWASAKNFKMMYEPLSGTGVDSILLFDSEKFAIITPPSINNPAQSFERQFSYETKIKDGIYGNLAIGDINSDGRADIITIEYKRNHVEILTLDGNNRPVPAMRFKIFAEKSYRDNDRRGKAGVEPRELKIADVTGDGKDDLITVIHDRILIYPQD